jgi:hypothetical protein
MKTLFGLVLCGLASGCLAQDEGTLKRPHKTAPIISTAPVTQGEADATFARVAGLFKSLLHVSVAAKKSQGPASSPVKRADVVAEFVRFYKAAEPAFTLTPASVHVDLPRITFDTAAERPGLIKMIERGCVGNYGPLATGKVQTLTVQDFGDSIGYFLSRISECTHLPSSKWTPYLHGN